MKNIYLARKDVSNKFMIFGSDRKMAEFRHSEEKGQV